TGSVGTGSGPCGASASDPARPGNACGASLPDGYPPPASCTPGPTHASTPRPKGGAQCVRRARWDLRGGQLEPTTGEELSLPRQPSTAHETKALQTYGFVVSGVNAWRACVH